MAEPKGKRKLTAAHIFFYSMVSAALLVVLLWLGSMEATDAGSALNLWAQIKHLGQSLWSHQPISF